MKTNLLWLTEDVRNTPVMTQSEAQKYCQSLSNLGKKWRLPTLRESVIAFNPTSKPFYEYYKKYEHPVFSSLDLYKFMTSDKAFEDKPALLGYPMTYEGSHTYYANIKTHVICVSTSS